MTREEYDKRYAEIDKEYEGTYEIPSVQLDLSLSYIDSLEKQLEEKTRENEDLRRRIDELCAAGVSGWVSVSDLKPPYDVRLLVSGENLDRVVMTLRHIDCVDSDEWFGDDDDEDTVGLCYDSVDKWMELPEQ